MTPGKTMPSGAWSSRQLAAGLIRAYDISGTRGGKWEPRPDGKLDKDELRIGAQGFARLDANGDRQVTADEMAAAIDGLKLDDRTQFERLTRTHERARRNQNALTRYYLPTLFGGAAGLLALGALLPATTPLLAGIAGAAVAGSAGLVLLGIASLMPLSGELIDLGLQKVFGDALTAKARLDEQLSDLFR